MRAKIIVIGVLVYGAVAAAGLFAGQQIAMAANENSGIGSGNSNGNSGNEPKAFKVSGVVVNIAPGPPNPLPVVVSNPSNQDIRLLTLSAVVALLPSPPAPVGAPSCDVSKLTVAPYNSNLASAKVYRVPAKGELSVPLSITLENTASNQDGCKGRKYTLSYSGTAEQWH